jgi:hypothetical protein
MHLVVKKEKRGSRVDELIESQKRSYGQIFFQKIQARPEIQMSWDCCCGGAN